MGAICGKGPVAPMFTRTSTMFVMSVLDPGVKKDFMFNATYWIVDRKYRVNETFHGKTGLRVFDQARNNPAYIVIEQGYTLDLFLYKEESYYL